MVLSNALLNLLAGFIHTVFYILYVCKDFNLKICQKLDVCQMCYVCANY